MLGRRQLWAGVAGSCFAILIGCAQRECCAPGHGGDGAALSMLAPIERGVVAPDVSQLGAVDDLHRLFDPSGPRPLAYCELTPEQCQCLAVESSVVGNLLAAELRVARCTSNDDDPCSAERVKRDVLAGSAAEARNTSAADALRMYYLLLESEGRLDLVRRAEQETNATLARLADVRRQGVVVPVDETELLRNQAELHGRRLELEVTIKHLNDRLWRLIGQMPEPPGAYLWPVADLTVRAEPIDSETAVAQGMAMRPELNMLRRLQSSITAESVSSVRAALGQINGLLGLEPGAPDVCRLRLLCYKVSKNRQAEDEAALRRRQLREYTTERERQVAIEIIEAVETVELRVKQIALARDQSTLWSRRLAELRGRMSTGGATFAEVSAAQLRAWEADGDLLALVSAWKTAQVELKKAQGLLVAECPH